MFSEVVGEREEDEGEDGFPPDERGQAMHRGPPPRAGQRWKDSRAVHDRDDCGGAGGVIHRCGVPEALGA